MTQLSNKEIKLRAALQEHAAYWDAGVHHAWEDGTSVLLDNSVFIALIELAATASAENVRRFIDWVSE